MYKKKIFIAFEGIEGSGKTSHSLSLLKKIKSLKVPCVYLREPGGSKEAEIIRKHLASKDEDAYSISGHIGWGTQDAAVLPNSKYFTTPDYEGYAGNMQNHWGRNIFDAPAKYNGFAIKPWILFNSDIFVIALSGKKCLGSKILIN